MNPVKIIGLGTEAKVAHSFSFSSRCLGLFAFIQSAQMTFQCFSKSKTRFHWVVTRQSFLFILHVSDCNFGCSNALRLGIWFLNITRLAYPALNRAKKKKKRICNDDIETKQFILYCLIYYVFFSQEFLCLLSNL